MSHRLPLGALLLISSTFALAACGGDDGNVAIDGRPIDAPTIDGNDVDAPTVDAPVPDAPTIDAAMIDAAAIDAMAPTDAAVDAMVQTDAAPDAMAPLPGDICSTAEPITLIGGTATIGATTLAYTNDYQPTCAGATSAGPDRVHSITVPANQRLTATVTPNSAYDAGVYLVGGPAAMCNATPIVCLGSNDDGGNGEPDTAIFDNTTNAPVDVLVIIDGFRAAGNTYSLGVTVGAIPATPPGDTCQLAEAITLTAGVGQATGTTTTAAGYANNYEPPDTCVDGSIDDGNDRVYSVVVPDGQRITGVVTPEAAFDASIYMVAAPPSNCDATDIACLDGQDLCGEGETDSAHYDNTTGGSVTVLVVVDSYTPSESGTFTLDVTVGAIPPSAAGDTCQNAEMVTLTAGMATVTGTTAGAAGYFDDYEPPSACTSGSFVDGNDHVHVVTVGNGATLTATLTPTGGWDPALYLVAGPAASCDATDIVCLDGTDDNGTDEAETVTYTNSSGASVDVMIVADSWDPSEEGTYSLAVMVQ